MTERLRATPYGAYHQADPRRASTTEDEGLGPKKTMIVLVIVVGCFAVLWPKLFYPMLVNNVNSQIKPGPVDRTTGCCDVISELDVNTINIMSELCSTIIDSKGKTPPNPQEIVIQCKKAVLETCGIDISAALQDRISLGHSVKQILEEVRSLNGSLCLKYNFGLSPWRLGVPHRINIQLDPINSIKQERPTHPRAEMVHPAFKERGRAIPQPDASGIPRRPISAPRIVEGRPGPIPGMRPTMTGPGHMVPPSKQSNYGFMGVLMPIYTVGFVVFFAYTIMKLVFKKKPEAYVGAPLYPQCDSDEHFRKEVFEANRNYFHRPNRDTSKIVVNAVSALLEEVNQELEARKIKTPETLVEQDEIKANGSLPKEDEQGTVTVMGMETTASSESGKKWSRPDSPVLPHPQPVAPKEPSPPPQQIFLEGSLPPQSQILVADSAIEAQKDSEDDSPVVLAGKMTLSVISLDSETGTEDSSNSGKKAETSDEERRTSSSNVSEEFEKINAADLEDQINNIIEEAENIALNEENRYSLNEELDNLTEEIHTAPQINEKDKENDVLEEIKNQLNLEDDLLLALKEKEPEGKVSLPVTDIIKEFLNNEENALLQEIKEIEIREDPEILARKRSVSEERHENVKEGSETVNDINKEEDTSVTEKEDIEISEKEQVGLVAEDQAMMITKQDRTLDEEVTNKKFDENNAINNDINKEEGTNVIEEKEGEAFSTETEEIKMSVKEELNSKTAPEYSLEPEIYRDRSKSQSREGSQESNSSNKADLLLQGLMVKDDNEPLDLNEDIASNEKLIFEEPEQASAVIQEPSFSTDLPVAEDLQERYNEDTKQDVNTSRLTDSEEVLLDDADYDDSENEELDDEVRDINRDIYEDRRESVERRLNGDDVDFSRNGNAEENEISEDEDLENDDDEEIEEVIEYVDNTDEEGEEVIEINGNEQRHLNENGEN